MVRNSINVLNTCTPITNINDCVRCTVWQYSYMSCKSEKWSESCNCALHEGVGGSGGTGAHILNLHPGWRCGELNNLTTITTSSLPPPTSREKFSLAIGIGGWVDSIVRLHAVDLGCPNFLRQRDIAVLVGYFVDCMWKNKSEVYLTT